MPSIDDGTVYRVLHRLVMFKGQRLSYRTLDVEQIGSVYESLMGYHVLRVTSPAVRLGKFNVWVESGVVRRMPAADRARYFKDTCGLSPATAQSLEKGLKDANNDEEVAAVLGAQVAKRDDALRHRAATARLVLQPGEERRRTASHYTPRSLTEKVVRRTLEPLLACLGEERSPEQILMLKICDPAMGSGAFLVETCRELASEVVAAWTRRGELARIVEEHGDAHLHARRLVAQQCLYGVDKNAAAVELAKLSLWLVTLSKALPFTFVDHALRHGDSLVGLNFKQIEAFHWSPPGQVETCRVLLREALDQAVELRQQILALADHEDPVSQGEKRRLFEFSQQAIDRVRLVADVCVGAFFAESKDAAREKERVRRLRMVEQWLTFDMRAGDATRSEEQRTADAQAAADVRAELDEMAAEIRHRVTPFHWWIEFPEVFFEERPDPLQGGAATGAALMEGVVGNPPFMGQARISGEFGESYRDWLFTQNAGVGGKADLCVHFFRRAGRVLGDHGAFGLVATNTIAQGDTREGGLRILLAEGWTIFDAVNSMPWPGSAAVIVSVVHAAKGIPAELVQARVVVPRLDGALVTTINSRLRARPERTDAVALSTNASLSYSGCKVGGQGFVLEPQEAARLLAVRSGNQTCVREYIGGEEVNTHPQQAPSRYVIDFGKRSLAEAEAWPELLAIVRERVKPYRETVKRESWSARWWQFAEVYPAMRAAVAPLPRVLVTAIVTKHLIFSFQPTHRVFSHKLFVFPFDGMTAFGVLQSRVHGPWAWLLSSTMKADLNYSASDCFETFPFPTVDPRLALPEIESAGQRLYDARAQLMVDNDQGLTKTYNALKDPTFEDKRLEELRRLHEALDRAVLDAYGWKDIPVPPFCPRTPAERAALRDFEEEVVDRLYALNADRTRHEKQTGRVAPIAPMRPASAAAEVRASAPTNRLQGSEVPGTQGKLFDQ
jgi:hypothetical protein